MTKIIVIIPVSHTSTHLSVKPLTDVSGKSRIQRVYEQAKKAKSLSSEIVATDHEDTGT